MARCLFAIWLVLALSLSGCSSSTTEQSGKVKLDPNMKLNEPDPEPGQEPAGASPAAQPN